MSTRPVRLILLPGMDGTGALFNALLQALPSEPVPTVVSYPTDTVLDLDGLVAYVEVRLPQGERYVLVGESFSGLVAARVASRMPVGLVGLALVASFLRYPPAMALCWRALARDLLFTVTPPGVVLRVLLLGGDAHRDLVDEAQSAIRRVAPAVLAARLRAVLDVDVREALARTAVPVLYLGGARDRLVGSWAIRQVTEAKRDAVVEVLDAPHFVLQRRPEESAAALVRFAQRFAGDVDEMRRPGGPA